MRKLLILTFILLLALTSCKKSVLDVENNNAITSSNFWKTESDIEKGVVAIYNMYYKQGTWTRNIYTQMNGLADDGVSFSGWVELNEWSKFIYKNYNFGEVNGKIWSEHYKAVFRANQVLDHIDNISFSNAANKNNLKGQALFFRAFYYFYMAILWEDVPLVLKTSSAADRPTQKKVNEIWTQIEEDLKAAVDLLPATVTSDNYGRITRGAAYALLGKAYSQQGKWDEAAQALHWLVEGDGKTYYDLVSDYEDNFKNNTENNRESVLEIQFSQVLNTGFDVDFDANSNLGTQIAINQAPRGLGWNNIQARNWLIDYYKREKTVDGKNDMRLFYNLWYKDAGKDFPQRADTLIYGRKWTDDPTWSNNVYIKKYGSKLPGTQTEFYWHDINFRLIRYADVLLLYAEALNEINSSPTAKAIECLNKVRNRSNLPSILNSTYYNGNNITSSKVAFREHIKIERALELSLECVRWIDLKRWGLSDASTIETLKSRDADFNNFVIGKSYRMPIPQSEVDNNPNLKQNIPY